MYREFFAVWCGVRWGGVGWGGVLCYVVLYYVVCLAARCCYVLRWCRAAIFSFFLFGAVLCCGVLCRAVLL